MVKDVLVPSINFNLFKLLRIIPTANIVQVAQ